MSPSNNPPTPGEIEFLNLMAARKLQAERWNAPNGTADPDFLVHTLHGKVLCEVKDFDEGKLDKEIIANAKAGRPTVGACDPSRRTRTKIWDSVEQLAEANEKFPTMTVLFNRGFFPHELDHFVREAFFCNARNGTSSFCPTDMCC